MLREGHYTVLSQVNALNSFPVLAASAGRKIITVGGPMEIILISFFDFFNHCSAAHTSVHGKINVCRD